jgi:hypothetical protein
MRLALLQGGIAVYEPSVGHGPDVVIDAQDLWESQRK